MMIRINNLKTETILGVYPAERKAKRPVVISLAMQYDATIAADSDKLEDALDYDVIEKSIMASVPKQKFQLLEALAAHVAQLVIAVDRVQRVTVVVDKPKATANADSMSVEYTISK